MQSVAKMTYAELEQREAEIVGELDTFRKELQQQWERRRSDVAAELQAIRARQELLGPPDDSLPHSPCRLSVQPICVSSRSELTREAVSQAALCRTIDAKVARFLTVAGASRSTTIAKYLLVPTHKVAEALDRGRRQKFRQTSVEGLWDVIRTEETKQS